MKLTFAIYAFAAFFSSIFIIQYVSIPDRRKAGNLYKPAIALTVVWFLTDRLVWINTDYDTIEHATCLTVNGSLCEKPGAEPPVKEEQPAAVDISNASRSDDADYWYQQAESHYFVQLYEEAKAEYIRACNLGSIKACSSIGQIFMLGEPPPKDMVLARQYATIGCEGHDPRGCNVLGQLLENGYGGIKDLQQAKAAYKISCDLKEYNACFNLGALLQRGEDGNPDYVLAASLLREACDQDIAGACNNLGVLYKDGKGVTKSRSTALSLYEKACELGEGAGCRNFDAIYYSN